MKDISQIDWSAPYSKRVSADPIKQKVFYIQDGIEYDATGKACNAKQIKEHYKALADKAQQDADAAKEAAAAAQATADELLKSSKARAK